MLDIIRVSAAFVVAFGHFSQRAFTANWRQSTGLAVDAVAVFFVLSGFVIRYVTTRKKATFGDYLRDRASRIYSVALPALALTIVLAVAARHCNPALYANWRDPHLAGPVQIGLNLVFCGQLWYSTVDPLTNPPYWSINYEVAYYLIYGCFYYLKGASRWISIAALCLLFGPRILSLFPLWIAGCICHDVYQRWKLSGTLSRNVARAIGIPLAAGCLIYLGITSMRWTHAVITAWQFLDATLGPQKMPLRTYLLGFLLTSLFMGLLLIARGVRLQSDSAPVKWIRFISEGTFPIYLFHFPIFVCIAACVPYNHASKRVTVPILVGVLALGVLAGHPLNLLKVRLRTLIS